MTSAQRNILHLITGLSTGGAERTLYNLLRGGLAERFDNKVVSLTDEGSFGPRIRALDVPVVTLGMARGRPSPLVLGRLRCAVREFRPDVVQGWMYHGNLAATVAARLAPNRPKLVWNIRHSLYRLDNEKRTTRWAIRGNRLLSASPSAIVYNSHLSRAQHEAFGYCAGRGCMLPNGFDLARFRPDIKAWRAVHAELGILDGARVIGHVARLHPMKNHPGYLRTLRPILARYPDVHAVLIGRDVTSDHPMLTTGLGELPADRVHCLGERNDTERLMAGMDVVVVSSSYGEAFPNVLGEAMACGVPCVATGVGDSARIIGDTGYVVPARDPRALSEALERMLSLPADERAVLGRAARLRIKANYSIETVVDQYRCLYERLVEEPE